ncbi:MAG: NEW3 domain-containing protein [Candidatus Aenigmatarchaeota archaeon]
MKQILIWGAVFTVIMAASAMAVDFSADVSEEPEVFAGDTAVFEATITNAGTQNWFSLSVFPTDWIRLESPSVKVPGGGSFTVKIYVTPPEDTKAGSYSLDFHVQKAGERIEVPFIVNVKQRTSAALIKDFETSCTSCKDSVNVSMKIENVGTSAIKDATLSLMLGKKEKKIEIGQMNISGSTEISETFSLEGYSPGSFSIVAVLIGNGINLDTETREFEVAVIDNIDIERDVSSFLFGSTIKLVATNKGNTEKEAGISSSVSQYFWVVYSGPQPDERGAEWVWKRTLKPGESAEVKYSEFIWPIPVIMIILVIAILFSYLQATALAVKKRMFRTMDEYAMSILIKNRGAEAHNVLVRDVIPPTFNLSGKFETLKPVAKKTGFGTELFWKIGRVRKGEEMILHYRIKPVSRIRGTMQLPAASVKAKRGDKTLFVYSGKPVITGAHGPKPKLKVKTE